MDVSAYLRNQGWRGDGHSLDHSNRGITKPLLISKKVDVLGVGLNKYKAVSDQWWMRAFDQGLKSLGTGKETALSQVQKHGTNRGGLYANFVKGERFEGSIGTSVLPTPEVSEDAVEKEPAGFGNNTSAKMSTKRKREPDEVKERPAQKRARRKYEKQEKTRAQIIEKRREERLKAIEDGTYDEKAEAEQILARKREKDINNKAKEFILDAQRRGIIPYGPNEIRRGLIATASNAVVQGDPSQDLLTVLSGAGIDPAKPIKVSGSVKNQKYARMKVQRELKRAAKAYLMGEPMTPLPASKEERKRLKKELKEKNGPSEEQTRQKREAREREMAEKTAAREKKNVERKGRREQQREEKQVIDQIIAECDAENNEGERLLKSQKIDASAFDHDADEIKFNISNKGTLRKVPRVGVVDKYPSKGEKKAKKIQADAIKDEIGYEELTRRVKENQRARYGLDEAKFEQYHERAKSKGLTLGEYVQRRQKKKKELDAEKKRQNLVKKWEGVEGELIVDDSKLPNNKTRPEIGRTDAVDPNLAEDADSNDADIQKQGFGFVSDTAGDQKLEFKVSAMKESYANKPKPNEVISDLRAAQINNVPITSLPIISPKISEPTNLASKAIAAITEERPFTVVDAKGETSLHWQPGTPIPPDARIWEGVVVSELPRKIREARKRWMAIRREEKKKLLDPDYRKVVKKDRAARKLETREKFLRAILYASRTAVAKNGTWGGYADVFGRQNVPLVHVESTEGKFSKFEVSLARTVARRMQRDEKRAERAEKGKGKGWKKRERSEKQGRIERGISGFVDKWRND